MKGKRYTTEDKLHILREWVKTAEAVERVQEPELKKLLTTIVLSPPA